jgi:hypothetical protein
MELHAEVISQKKKKYEHADKGGKRAKKRKNETKEK